MFYYKLFIRSTNTSLFAHQRIVLPMRCRLNTRKNHLFYRSRFLYPPLSCPGFLSTVVDTAYKIRYERGGKQI
jgi:hypothetical protein